MAHFCRFLPVFGVFLGFSKLLGDPYRCPMFTHDPLWGRFRPSEFQKRPYLASAIFAFLPP